MHKPRNRQLNHARISTILAILAVTAALTSSCSSSPTERPTHAQENAANATASANKGETTEYVSLSDIYDVTFEGVSPYLKIKYTPKIAQLPLWKGQTGNNSEQKQVKFLIEGEVYEDEAKADGSSRAKMTEDSKRDGKLKNGDTITLLPDEHKTNYAIPGGGSLELGTYSNEDGSTTKYVLKDNTLTISGANELAYKPELVTDEMTQFFIDRLKTDENGKDVDYEDVKRAFEDAKLIRRYSGIIFHTGDDNVTVSDLNLAATYYGVNKDPNSHIKYSLLLILSATLTQGENAPVTAFVSCRFDNPQINSATATFSSPNENYYERFGKFSAELMMNVVHTEASKEQSTLLVENQDTQQKFDWTKVN